jgi:guanylate kinase
LLERDDALWLSRSWTTRSRREGERAESYVFVDRAAFDERVREGGFLEWAVVLDEKYGTPMPDPPPGKDVVLEIDVQGAEQVLQRCPDAVCVLLLPPSQEVQATRLRGRGDPEGHVQRRLALGREEEERGRRLAAHVIVNDELERTVDELVGVVGAARRAESAENGENGENGESGENGDNSESA